MNEFLARLTSESPAFFKKLQKVGLWLVGVASSILLLDLPESITIPPVIMTISTYVFVFGGVLFGGAKLPVKDHGELQDKLNK